MSDTKIKYTTECSQGGGTKPIEDNSWGLVKYSLLSLNVCDKTKFINQRISSIQKSKPNSTISRFPIPEKKQSFQNNLGIGVKSKNLNMRLNKYQDELSPFEHKLRCIHCLKEESQAERTGVNIRVRVRKEGRMTDRDVLHSKEKQCYKETKV